jgi:hypothetical protein
VSNVLLHCFLTPLPKKKAVGTASFDD